MKKIARSLRQHRELILNYFQAGRLTSSGVVEGLYTRTNHVAVPRIILYSKRAPDKTGLRQGGRFRSCLQIMRIGVVLDHLHPPCPATVTSNCHSRSTLPACSAMIASVNPAVNQPKWDPTRSCMHGGVSLIPRQQSPKECARRPRCRHKSTFITRFTGCVLSKEH
jgi:hypothetical protein